MIHATIKDKEYVINILHNAFISNPTLCALSRNKNGTPCIRPILEYAFFFTLRRKGIFLSDDRKVVAFMYDSKPVRRNLTEIYYLFRLILFGINIMKIKSIIRHLGNMKNYKPKNSAFYHFWFLGAGKDSDLTTTKKFITELMELSNRNQLPVYAETSLEKNETVYKKFGFSTFETIKNSDLKLTVYLMKKLPERSNHLSGKTKEKIPEIRHRQIE